MATVAELIEEYKEVKPSVIAEIKLGHFDAVDKMTDQQYAGNVLVTVGPENALSWWENDAPPPLRAKRPGLAAILREAKPA